MEDKGKRPPEESVGSKGETSISSEQIDKAFSELMEKEAGFEEEIKAKDLAERREKLGKACVSLEGEFVELESCARSAISAQGGLLQTMGAAQTFYAFKNLYRQYQRLLEEAEAVGIIEPGFEKKYRKLYAEADDYEFIEVPRGKRLSPTRYADEEGKIFYRFNYRNPEQFFTYSVLSPDRTEVQGSISEYKYMDSLRSKGAIGRDTKLEDILDEIEPKGFLDIIMQRGHILPLWKDNPYLKEIKDETMRLQLRNMPEIEQLERDIKTARDSADSTETDYLVVGMLTSVTVILAVIVFLVYKLHIGSINKEITELEATKSLLVQEIDAKKEELTKQRVAEVPVKQSIYNQMKSINTLFKPLKAELIQRDPSLSNEEDQDDIRPKK